MLILFQVALQTAGIVSGLPYTFIISLLCISIWRAVQVAAGDLDPFGPKFTIGLFDPVGAEPLKVLRKKPKVATDLFLQFLANIVIAPWTVAVAAQKLAGQKHKVWVYSLATIPFFILAIAFHLAELGAHGCWAIGWFWYLSFVTAVTGVRLQAREKFGIHGNVFEDFISTLLFYPCVAVQLEKMTKDLNSDELRQHLEVVCQKETTKDNDKGNLNLSFKN
jgi:hypothetical protein